VPPTASFPIITLPRKVRQAAERKQAEYRRAAAREQQEQEKKQKKTKVGLLATLLLDEDEEESTVVATATATTEKPKKEEWFDFLSEGTPGLVEEKKESDWFRWGKGKERKAEEPDWFGSFGKSTDALPGGDVGGSVVEDAVAGATEVAEQTNVKEEPDWFSWLVPKGDPGRSDEQSSAGFDAVTTAEPPPLSVEPTPAEPSEPEAKKPSVLGKIFGSVPAIKIDMPKPVGAERVAPGATVETPKPVVVELPEPAVIEKPKPVPIEAPKMKKKERVPIVEEAPPAVIAPEMSAYVLPDPKKLFWGGEDATFVKGRSFGVFDGVSGADKVDGLPLYSITLAREMKSRVGTQGLEMNDMIAFLSSSVEVANKRATGASTALVGSISEDGVLRVLNVGDCTAVVVRDDKVVARTREINHFYECPYQLSTISPDTPRDGTKLNLPLKPGDVIIAGSDGVFDNLDEQTLVDEVKKSSKKASVLAKRVSDLSRRVSQNPKAVTPFSKLALQKRNPDYPDGIGGKVDDVCCVAVCYGR
jgi:protein phosphatase PTC7